MVTESCSGSGTGLSECPLLESEMALDCARSWRDEQHGAKAVPAPLCLGITGLTSWVTFFDLHRPSYFVKLEGIS